MGSGKTRMVIFVFGINAQLCLSMVGVTLSCDQLFVVGPKTRTYNGWMPWIGATFAAMRNHPCIDRLDIGMGEGDGREPIDDATRRTAPETRRPAHRVCQACRSRRRRVCRNLHQVDTKGVEGNRTAT